MLRLKTGKSLYTYGAAAAATAAFRLVLAALQHSGHLSDGDIPGVSALGAFYVICVVVVWLGQRPHRSTKSVHS